MGNDEVRVPLLKAPESASRGLAGGFSSPPTDEKEALRKGLVLNNHQKNLQREWLLFGSS